MRADYILKAAAATAFTKFHAH